ncbi:MAG: chemotaxis protein CheD [Pirellulales bacterium]|nr:chemotaxis protein CheD [Pirellulales bacterium]
MTATVTKARTIRVKMAGVDFGKSPDFLETLLGSCIGIAVWDRGGKQGGLAHIVLPRSRGTVSLPGKFADTAVLELKRRLVAQGAYPGRLTAKITGGATMFGPRNERDVGQQNCQAVLAHLREHGIPVVAQHIGGNKGRIVRFSLADGSVEVSIAREVVAVL